MTDGKIAITGSGWCACPNAIFEAGLGGINTAVLGYLFRRAGNDGSCFPSFSRIASDLGIGRRSAVRSIQSLKNSGWIEVEPGTDGRSNIYTLSAMATGVKAVDRSPSDTSAVAALGRGHGGTKVVPQRHSKKTHLRDVFKGGPGDDDGVELSVELQEAHFQLMSPDFGFGSEKALRIVSERGTTPTDLEAWRKFKSQHGGKATLYAIRLHRNPDDIPAEDRPDFKPSRPRREVADEPQPLYHRKFDLSR